ncbi:MAG: alanine racemase, partial [Chitinophagaceae bacterium]
MGNSLKNIASILSLTGSDYGDQVIEYLVTDSRKLIFPEHSLFVAIKGPRRSGTNFIADLYHRGVRCFLIDEEIDQSLYPSAIFLQVPNSIKALQQIAAYHRHQFLIPVIGITGSNGKTIVKEWLYQLLSPDFNIVRSPRSYNSQIGVPLSVWQMNPQHTLAIFEAGISTKGEMDALANMIQPTIGVLTNIGEAHNEGFDSKEEKLAEKMRLFKSSEQTENTLSIPLIVGTDIVIREQVKLGEHTKVKGHYLESNFEFTIPFNDVISIQNALTCCAVMMKMGYASSVIQERTTQLVPVEMRMQLRKGSHQSFVLNDSYSNDLASLSLALPYLKEQSGEMATTVILSDIVESGKSAAELYGEVVRLLS